MMNPGINSRGDCYLRGAFLPALHFRTNREVTTGGDIMRICRLLAGLVAVCAIPVAAQETYVLDPVHSQPQYEARHIGFAIQHGNFGKMTGRVTLDRAAKTGTVDFTIDATSIKSNDPRLDAILKGERFFNVEKYPTLRFTWCSVTFDGYRVVAVAGE